MDLQLRAALIIWNSNLEVLCCHALGKKANTFDLPKGHMDETDASLIDAALRECREETGLSFTEEDLSSKTIAFNYGRGDTPMTAYFIKRPSVIDISKLHCDSLIDDSCKEVWKIGKPENDGFKLVKFEDLPRFLYKSYPQTFYDKVDDFFCNLQETN